MLCLYYIDGMLSLRAYKSQIGTVYIYEISYQKTEKKSTERDLSFSSLQNCETKLQDSIISQELTRTDFIDKGGKLTLFV